MVEGHSGGDGGIVTFGASGQLVWHDSPARRPDSDVIDPLPAPHVRRVKAEPFEASQRPGRESVAAALVAWEAGLVDDHDPAPGPGEGDGRRAPGRSRSDDNDVGRLRDRRL